MPYRPTLQSVRRRVRPGWYDDAKLGIFIHWGLFAVPAFAPTGHGDLNEVLRREGFEGWFCLSPYSEWYINSMRIPGSPTARFHREQFGADFPYQGFQPLFERAAQAFDAAPWARLFARAHARYVVMVAKHMDGYCLWPSRTPHPGIPGYGSARDLVGEVAEAVRREGLRFGVYYSSWLDQSLTTTAMRDVVAFYTEGGPRTRAYARHQLAHWKELIDRYAPSVLWGDIAYPARSNLYELFACFYDHVADGVVNDRWAQVPVPLEKILRRKAVRKLVTRLVEGAIRRGAPARNPQSRHFDYATYEYETPPDVRKEKWELCRGMSKGFGFNRNDTPDDHLDLTELIDLLADVVSKNGNLLLNVGPRADGSVPDEQRNLLKGLGRWLDVNGEAIFGTTPWTRASSETADGTVVRFTRRGSSVYAIVCGTLSRRDLTLPGVHPPVARVSLLGGAGLEVHASSDPRGTSVEIGKPVPFPFPVLRFQD